MVDDVDDHVVDDVDDVEDVDVDNEVEDVEEVVDELLVLLSVDQGSLVVPLVVLRVVSDVNGYPLGAVSVIPDVDDVVLVDDIVEELLDVLPVVHVVEDDVDDDVDDDVVSPPLGRPQNLLQLPPLRPTMEIEN